LAASPEEEVDAGSGGADVEGFFREPRRRGTDLADGGFFFRDRRFPPARFARTSLRAMWDFSFFRARRASLRAAFAAFSADLRAFLAAFNLALADFTLSFAARSVSFARSDAAVAC
jgi:hypothetical protein